MIVVSGQFSTKEMPTGREHRRVLSGSAVGAPMDDIHLVLVQLCYPSSREFQTEGTKVYNVFESDTDFLPKSNSRPHTDLAARKSVSDSKTL